MELFIETLTGTAFELRVSPFETIMSVKAKIQRLEGIPISQQHLIWQSVELEDDYCLHDYSIHDGATLKLVLAMRGGPINTRRIPMESEPVLREMAEYMEANRDDILDKLPGNRQVTLLVFREGEQLNFFRVIDRGDGTLTPLSESLSNTSVYNLNDEDDDDDCVPNQEQTEDNSKLKEKMKELRVRMDKLSLHRKPEPKLKLSSSGRANSRCSRLKRVSSSTYIKTGPHTSLKKAPCLPPVGKTYVSQASKEELQQQQRTSSSETDELNFNLDSDMGDFSSPDESLPCQSGLGTVYLKPTPEESEAAISAKEELTSALEAVVNKLSESVVDRRNSFEEQVGMKSSSDFLRRADSLSGESHVNISKAKPLMGLSSKNKDLASCSDSESNKLSTLRPPLIEPFSSSLTSDKKRISIDDLKGTFLPHPPSSTATSKSRDNKNEPSLLENRLSKQSSKLLSASRTESISSSNMPLLDSNNISSSTSNITSTGLDSVKETSSRSLSRYGQLDRRKEYTLESLSTSEARAMSGLLRQASIERLGSSRISNFVTSSSKSRLGNSCLGTGLKEGRVTTPEGRLVSARLRLVSSRDGRLLSSPGHRLPPVKTKKRTTKRCFLCAKKTGPATGFECRCGNNFCATHRYAEAHDCSFDYKTEGRKFLEQTNPVVSAPKLPKI